MPASVKGREEDTPLIGNLRNKNATLHKRLNKLEARVEALTMKNNELTQQMLKAQATECEIITLLLRQLHQALDASS